MSIATVDSESKMFEHLINTSLLAGVGGIGAVGAYAGYSIIALGFLPTVGYGIAAFSGGYLIYQIVKGEESFDDDLSQDYIGAIMHKNLRAIGSLVGGLMLPAVGLYYAGYAITVIGTVGFILTLSVPPAVFICSALLMKA